MKQKHTKYTLINANKSTHSEWAQCEKNPIRRTVRTAHLSVLTSTRLYCLVTESRVCEQLAPSHYMKVKQPGVKPATSSSQAQHLNY